jgi:hypothetical protein
MNARPFHHRDTPVPPIELHIIRASIDKDKTGRGTRNVLQRILINIVATQQRPDLDMPKALVPYINLARKGVAWLRYRLFPLRAAAESVLSLTIRPDRHTSISPLMRFTLQDASHLDEIEQASFYLLKNLSVLVGAYRDEAVASMSQSRSSPPTIEMCNHTEEISRIRAFLESSIKVCNVAFEDLSSVSSASLGRHQHHPSFGFLRDRSTLAKTPHHLHLPSVPLALHNGLRVMLSSLFNHILHKYEKSKIALVQETLLVCKNITTTTNDGGSGIDGKQIDAIQKELLRSILSDLSELQTGIITGIDECIVLTVHLQLLWECSPLHLELILDQISTRPTVPSTVNLKDRDGPLSSPPTWPR